MANGVFTVALVIILDFVPDALVLIYHYNAKHLFIETASFYIKFKREKKEKLVREQLFQPGVNNNGELTCLDSQQLLTIPING